MLGLTALEVAIGLSFIYFLFSLVVSRVNEGVASLLEWRAKGLKQGLRRLLTVQRTNQRSATDHRPPEAADGLAGKLWELSELKHPLMQGLDTPRVLLTKIKRDPSYLPARTFGLALLDVLAPPRPEPAEVTRLTEELRLSIADLAAKNASRAEQFRLLLPAAGTAFSAAQLDTLRSAIDDATDLDRDQKEPFRRLLDQIAIAPGTPIADIIASLERLGEHPAKAPLLAFAREAAGDLDRFRTAVERWFDDAMDRLSGWYKRKVQIAILLYALLLAVALNLDSLALARSLWLDGALRQVVVDAATPDQGDNSSQMEDPLEQVSDLDLPIGWTTGDSDDRRDVPSGWGGWLAKLLGLGITAAALTLGAPFWFDLLGRVARLRSTGPPPPGPEASERHDRPAPVE